MHKSLIKLFFLFLPFISTHAHSFCLPWLQDYQPAGGYISLFGGINGGYDLNCTDIKTNRGYYFGINGGKKIFPNLRLEGDIAWQGNDVNRVTFKMSPLTGVGGSVNIGSAMVNAICDLNFPFPGSPSIGAGVGYARAKGHWSGNLTQTINNLIIDERFKSSIKEEGLAWQIIANLNFFVCPKLKISVEYRFFKLDQNFSNYKFGLSLCKFF